MHYISALSIQHSNQFEFVDICAHIANIYMWREIQKPNTAANIMNRTKFPTSQNARRCYCGKMIDHQGPSRIIRMMIRTKRVLCSTEMDCSSHSVAAFTPATRCNRNFRNPSINISEFVKFRVKFPII